MSNDLLVIRIQKASDWNEALPRIQSSASDLFIIDQAQVNDNAGEILRQKAQKEGWGMCAAVTLTQFDVFEKPALCVWSAGRKVVSALGHTCELANNGHGELPRNIGEVGSESCESVWGSAVYVSRETIDKVGGFDANFIKYGLIPNMLWDDFSLQCLLKGVRIGYHPGVLSVIPLTSTRFPNESPTYKVWEDKWGWNPALPDLYKIRVKWQGTSLVKGILDSLLESWPSVTPPVDGIMLTVNSLDKLRRTLDRLSKTDYPNFSLTVLMNGSPKPVQEELEARKSTFPFELKLLYCPINVGVSPGLNWLKSQCTSPIIARLDDDIDMPPNWLRDMVGVLYRYPFCGCVLPSWIIPKPDGDMAVIGQVRLYPYFISEEPKEFAAPADSLHLSNFMGGACVLYRRKAMELAGDYDLRFAPAQNEDVDHGLSLRKAGYDIMILGSLVFTHYSNCFYGPSFNYAMTKTHQRKIFTTKWGRALAVLETSLDKYGRIVQLKELN